MKSEQNLTVAKLLHEQSYYSTVVHCAYYSCIQLMRHIFMVTMGRELKALQDLQKKQEKGSHEVLINEIREFIKSKENDEKNYRNKIGTLKRLRVEADYDDILIDEAKSKQAKQLCIEVQTILRKCI